MAWDKSLASLSNEIKQSVEDQTRGIAFFAFTRLQEISPVGNPSLWQNPNAAEPGYVGGTFRKSWQVDQDGQRWIVSNPQLYGPRLDDGHSKQAPNGLLDIVIADLINLT